ncbi:hypothetical protein KVF89_22610 [Nocardioides carbamazepini]|uniref:hypothetical protein n=1 Tax=Nocardioides carbamazepini TaxID=2854259 RepID=UPI00214A7A3F|nr:hypothetical protein [Nocardioides carbamazepini]MCR1785350.1 hypothetical protein [Nocardioides carbamazepini]
MSAPRAKRRIPVAKPGESYATQVAVVADRTVAADVQHARTATHDALIAAVGPARRSGVWWSEHPAASGVAAYKQIREGMEHPDDAQIFEWLNASPRSLLVVAWCIGAVPPGLAIAP